MRKKIKTAKLLNLGLGTGICSKCKMLLHRIVLKTVRKHGHMTPERAKEISDKYQSFLCDRCRGTIEDITQEAANGINPDI